jgi:hypothetical protein
MAEVERRAVDRRKLACRNQRRVDRRETIRLQRQLMIEDVAGARSGEVEVAVLREIDRRGLVRRRGVLHDELVVLREGVGDARVERAGITFVAGGADVREDDTGAAVAIEGLGLPHHLVEPLDAAVQVVRPLLVARR